METNSQKSIQQVTLDDMMREASVRSGKEVGPLTRIGYRLALFLLAYLSVVTLILLADYWANVPDLPDTKTLDQAQLDQYQKLSEIAMDRTVKLLDTLVLKGFLPVLTAVLGYIFGTRGADKEEE